MRFAPLVGADSDIVLDLIEKVKFPENEIHYIFFDTGIELDATKEQIKYLQERYGVQIETIKPEINVPKAVRKFGVPIVSKNVSYNINMLQRNGFKFEDKDYHEMVADYPKAQTAVRWWCNYYHSEYDNKTYERKRHGAYWKQTDSMFNICRNRHLKDFLMKEPLDFMVSNKCCYYAKVKPARDAIKKYRADLDVMGLRHSEGGRRSTLTKCFFPRKSKSGYDTYMPIFWMTNSDKKAYEEIFNIKHSRCYTEYGFDRTGCTGCPYNPHIEKDLEVYKKYEPLKLRACQAVFGKAYEWTKRFKDYKAEMSENNGEQKYNL